MLNLHLGINGYGAIYKLNGKDMDFVCTVNESASAIAYVMQPGEYKVVFRSKNGTSSLLTREQNFTIKSGVTTTVTLRN